MLAPFKKTANGYEILSGNPTLDSLDGKIRAPLQSILDSGWEPGYPALFGVYLVDLTPPEGKRWTGEIVEEHGRPRAVFEDITPSVPQSITRRQGRLMLLEIGKLDKVEAAINSIEDPVQRRAAQIEYEAETWERSNEFLKTMWQSLGGTEEELDNLFIEARSK